MALPPNGLTDLLYQLPRDPAGILRGLADAGCLSRAALADTPRLQMELADLLGQINAEPPMPGPSVQDRIAAWLTEGGWLSVRGIRMSHSMPGEEPVSGIRSRRTGRLLAALGAAAAFGLAIYTAITESVPEIHIVDGYWMLAGGVVALLLAAPVAWRLRRDRAILVVALATAIGAWVPIVLLALRANISILARFKGAIFFSSGDIIGIAMPVGAALAWLAVREYEY